MLAINLDLRNKTVLLVGGGSVGRRKLVKIIQAGALVRVIEPRPADYLTELAEKKQISLHGGFEPRLLEGVSLAFVATDDPEFNLRTARAARGLGIWVNQAVNPGEGDFFLPAVVEHGDFRLAVSTGGRSPALAAVAADRLRKNFGPEYGRLLSLLTALRPHVLASNLNGEARKALFRSLAESVPLLKLAADGDGRALTNFIKTLLPPDLMDEGRLMEIMNDVAGEPGEEDRTMCGNAH